MEKYFEPLILWLSQIATQMSVEVFVVVAGFLEEILAPVPSPFVMTTATVVAKAQQYSLFHLLILVVFAAAAKTFSSYLIYLLVDKAEDLVVGRFGRFFGVDHESVERVGKMLSNSWWDDVLLFLSRAIPMIPTSLVTVVAGVIKYDMRSFLLMTFLGSIVRNLFYLWIAYFGVKAMDGVLQQFAQNKIVLVAVVLVGMLSLVLFFKVKNIFFNSVMKKS